jgi:hypothetical protein
VVCEPRAEQAVASERMESEFRAWAQLRASEEENYLSLPDLWRAHQGATRTIDHLGCPNTGCPSRVRKHLQVNPSSIHGGQTYVAEIWRFGDDVEAELLTVVPAPFPDRCPFLATRMAPAVASRQDPCADR